VRAVDEQRGDLDELTLAACHRSAVTPRGLQVIRAFSEFAADYVRHYPSQSYSLGHLGDNFPRYLGETKPVDDSEDSREFGPVPEDLLLGKVIATFATGERIK